MLVFFTNGVGILWHALFYSFLGLGPFECCCGSLLCCYWGLLWCGFVVQCCYHVCLLVWRGLSVVFSWFLVRVWVLQELCCSACLCCGSRGLVFWQHVIWFWWFVLDFPLLLGVAFEHVCTCLPVSVLYQEVGGFLVS